MLYPRQSGGGAGVVPALMAAVASAQNPDGGWGYSGPVSWTEPTALAVLACLAAQAEPRCVQRALGLLRRLRRSDGGWPPTAGGGQSTGGTALAVLALDRAGALAGDPRPLQWLLRQTGRDSAWVTRIREFMLGVRGEYAGRDPGWPWFPGTAAWVVPTAMTILALRAWPDPGVQPQVNERIESGRKFLLARVCRDGGWNHGSSRALGYESDSYPETTGIALLALRGVDAPEVSRAVERARRHLRDCRSPSGAAWLQLGLLAHGESPSDLRASVRSDCYPCRGLLDVALALIVESAYQGRRVL